MNAGRVRYVGLERRRKGAGGFNAQVSRTLHHLGRGRFIVAGETIKLRSKMK